MLSFLRIEKKKMFQADISEERKSFMSQGNRKGLKDALLWKNVIKNIDKQGGHTEMQQDL